jgi:glycosyltransferase involved in cell wall biosynthesis
MTRKYRILHVIDSFDLGGAQEALLQMVKCCDLSRFEPEVACMHHHGVYIPKFKNTGIPIYSLSPHKFIPLYIANLIQLILRRRYDVVHCHLIASNLIAKPIAAALGVRVRFNHDQTNDHYRQQQKIRLTLDALTNRVSTHVLAVSESTRNFLITREHLPPQRVSLVHNGVDLRRFLPQRGQKADARHHWNLPVDCSIIGGVGRLNYQKNFSLFLEIAAEVLRTRSKVFFVLAGTGPEEGALRAQAERLRIQDHVRFLGYVEDTAKLYTALDILLMPSRFEGLPLTLLEAMAMQIPVVGSCVDGIAEAIIHGTDGLLVEPNDRADFVSNVVRLIDDSEFARQLGVEARKKVTSNFSGEAMTRKVESLYLRYLERA